MTFVTLEDETGTINVVIWRTTAEKHHRELLGSTPLTVTGHVERVETSAVPVVHLITAQLADQLHLLGDLKLASRDFTDRDARKEHAGHTVLAAFPWQFPRHARTFFEARPASNGRSRPADQTRPGASVS